MAKFLHVQAAMRTPLPKAPTYTPYHGRVHWTDCIQRPTDILAYINGPRRVYALDPGTYYVRHEGKRRLVDIHQVLRVMREAAVRELRTSQDHLADS